MKFILALLSVSTLILLPTKSANAISTTLYNGIGLPENNTPQWLIPGAIASNGSLTTVKANTVAGGIQVDSNGIGLNGKTAEYSGYSNYNPLTGNFVNSNFPNLARNIGYSVFFKMALDTINDFSDTNNNNRAAFSITAISSDLQGIEIGFDQEQIFAQNSNFQQVAAETQSFNTNIFTNYQLVISGNTYNLLANSGSGFASVINGSLRSYNFNPASSNPPLGLFNPYQISNFLFLGDNTGQAHATFTLGETSVESASVPFPFSPTLGFALVSIAYAAKKVTSSKVI